MNDLITISGVTGYIDENGTAMLKLEDVARGLGFVTVATSGNEVVRWNTTHKYLSDLGVATSCNGSDYRSMCPEFIPENVFYRLAMKAKNETAERFQSLVADEILPSIRKHGGYLTPAKVEEVLTDPDTIIRLATDLKKERERAKLLENKIEQDKPKVLFADAVAGSKSSILVRDLAKILSQNGYPTGEARLYATLREQGYIIRKPGRDYNSPTQRSIELGVMEIRETAITTSGGSKVKKTPLITGKGQQYFVKKFCGQAERRGADG